MKRNALFIVFVLLLLIYCFLFIFRTEQMKVAEPNGSVFDHDFGIVPTNQELLHVFNVPISAPKPIRPTTVHVSCNCLKAQVPQKWYKPGDTMPVRVLLKTRDHAATMLQRLTIDFEGCSSKCMLTVRANVKETIGVSIDRIDIGYDSRSPDKSTAFFVSNYGSSEWGDIKVESNAEWISVVCHNIDCNASPGNETARQCWRCDVSMDLRNVAPSLYRSSLRISDVAHKNVFEMPVSVNVVPEAMLYPSSWYFFSAKSAGLKEGLQKSTLVFRFDTERNVSDLGVDLSDSLVGLLDIDIKQSEQEGGRFDLIGKLAKNVLIETKGTVEIRYCVNERTQSLALPVLIVP
jgi:hypothetical protein